MQQRFLGLGLLHIQFCRFYLVFASAGRFFSRWSLLGVLSCVLLVWLGGCLFLIGVFFSVWSILFPFHCSFWLLGQALLLVLSCYFLLLLWTVVPALSVLQVFGWQRNNNVFAKGYSLYSTSQLNQSGPRNQHCVPYSLIPYGCVGVEEFTALPKLFPTFITLTSPTFLQAL